MALFNRNQPKAGPDRPLTNADLRVRRNYANVTTVPVSSPNVLSGPGWLHKVIVNNPVTAGAVFDSYGEANKSNDESMASDLDNAEGQSFTGNGQTLESAKFWMRKTFSPTGTMVSKVYAHTGTYGSTGVPTGAALATSGTIDVTTLTTSYALVEFTYTAADRIALTNGTKYVVTVEYSTSPFATGTVLAGSDLSTPTHGGNQSHFISGTWFAYSGRDLIFYILSSGGNLSIYDSDGGSNIETVGTINTATVIPGAVFDYDRPLKYGLDVYPPNPCDLTAIISF